MSKLVLKLGNAVLQEFDALESEFSIGRAPDNAIVIDNPAASYYHARIFVQNGQLMVEDFGTLNGTLVNGERIKVLRLEPGDLVSIGKHTIEVVDPAKHHGVKRHSRSAQY